MRVLLVHNRYLLRGGEQQAVEAEAAMLAGRGVEVEVLEESNERIAALGPLRSAGRTVWSAEAGRRVSSALAAGRHDLVHVHNFFPLLSPAVHHAAHRLRVPVVQTLHNYRLFCLNPTPYRRGSVCTDCLGRLPLAGVRHACYRDSRTASAAVAAMLAVHRALGTWRRCVTSFVCLSRFSRDVLARAGLPGDRLEVKPGCVTPDPGAKERAGSGAVFAGRLTAAKGVRTLLEAWRRVGAAVPLTVIGAGVLEGEAAAAAREVPGLRWLGARDHREVLDAMRAAAFAVVPAESFENSPTVVAEAFATGTPVLASALGSVGEVVRDGVTGTHFPAGDAEALAREALALAARPGAIEAMGRAARARFEEIFAADANSSLLLAIYGRALERAGRRAAG